MDSKQQLRYEVQQLRRELQAVEVMVQMMEEGEWAEHVGGTHPIASRLEGAITQLHNELRQQSSELERNIASIFQLEMRDDVRQALTAHLQQISKYINTDDEVTLSITLNSEFPPPPIKPGTVSQQYWDRAMEGYRFVTKTQNTPLTTSVNSIRVINTGTLYEEDGND